MKYTKSAIQEFLAQVPPFSQLSPNALEKLAQKLQLLRYRIGQKICVQETMPPHIALIYEGQGRLLAQDPRTQLLRTLNILKPGEIVGWESLLRGFPCETVIASTEVTCLVLKAAEFRGLLAQEPALVEAFRSRCGWVEVFDLLGRELERRADGATDLKDLTFNLQAEAIVRNLPSDRKLLQPLDPEYLWFISGGVASVEDVGHRLVDASIQLPPSSEGTESIRIVGFPKVEFDRQLTATALESAPVPVHGEVVPYATDEDLAADPDSIPQSEKTHYPWISARGPVDATIACFQMLSQFLGFRLQRDTVRRIITDQAQRTGNISLQLCGAIAELQGLHSQLVTIPVVQMSRIETPALIRWQDSFAILYEISDREFVLASPESGLLRQRPNLFAEMWGDSGEVLLLKLTKQTPQQRFSLKWFLPSVKRHSRVLIEVFIASFFVQIFALGQPLLFQIIIDKVINTGGLDSLNVLGVLMLVMAIFEGILSSLRTYLFVDTANRIDMNLGTEVIDHLLRLPLSYFEKRPVGDIASRLNELETIRQFLTGTALTAVLDSVFSVIYIVVMFIYNVPMTLIALSVVPLFGILTAIASPLRRQQLRAKAARAGETQAYLVEVVSGIQTVKAQNIELNARWQWQDRYARYVSAGFKTVMTSTTANSLGTFFNKLSNILLIWVGAYLVVNNQLTVGQLIAFRIIDSYATGPLIRLMQLWQNFQEVSISLDRLSDIIDTPQEVETTGRDNIPMPQIKGSVRYENVFFRFKPQGSWQINNVSINIPHGAFVGVAGQSGSGKSTLVKLLTRLYDLEAGRIVIDKYDIGKVELHSLRAQIGVVLQDTLLFDGTVQQNIALTNPDATPEQIVEAARIAYAHDFIMNLPIGYNSNVGERGAALSGGQRQRVAIARTVLQNPSLLILDEATSALDYNAEHQVCENLKVAFKDRTVFFITHRLPSIKSADIILMMDQGSVVEQGTHHELMSLRGLYYCLYQQQESEI
ncbi:peptidase C39 [Neosynechococcus sphagnicola sy1]|uniref:Peptidase C39 n=1 Tax=Neosynechococcus sphagnicola sy1 TaxID=1497020 RepID=A0A098TJ41_9CYAN|nr:peptidase domain-containing ABC transporter [Neosynechococcus sphagnicola]KGF72017.1 peptidase C39 [Neosynechococcus sphagnicola sy1]